MMTSGGGVKYKGSIDCGMQILKNEGFMSMMKGAGANILRGVAGAGVLAGFDKFQVLTLICSFQTVEYLDLYISNQASLHCLKLLYYQAMYIAWRTG